MHLDIQTRKTLLSRIPASLASGYPNAAFRYRQAGHLYIQSRDFASESDPCKQGICPDICSNRACARYRQAIHLSDNSRFAVTGKLGICPPNAKNDRFPEIGKRSFCLPGLLGKSPIPSCAIGTTARFLQNRFRGKSEELRNHLPAVVLLLRFPDQREAGDEAYRQGNPAEGFFKNAGDDTGD